MPGQEANGRRGTCSHRAAEPGLEGAAVVLGPGPPSLCGLGWFTPWPRSPGADHLPATTEFSCWESAARTNGRAKMRLVCASSERHGQAAALPSPQAGAREWAGGGSGEVALPGPEGTLGKGQSLRPLGNGAAGGEVSQEAREDGKAWRVGSTSQGAWGVDSYVSDDGGTNGHRRGHPQAWGARELVPY